MVFKTVDYDDTIYQMIAKRNIIATAGVGLALLGSGVVANNLNSSSNINENSPHSSLKTGEITVERPQKTCTSDCVDYDAGYAYAKVNKLCEPNYNRGKNKSYNEGVQVWAWDNCYYGDGENPI